MDAAAEACIICLNDLPLVHATASDADPDASRSAQDNDDDDVPIARTRRHKSSRTNADLVANLRPCNHYLHDDCIKQWIQKANSCPICRTLFNVVDLSAGVGGPTVESYVVQDKTQVADLDPSFLVGDDESLEPCIVCGADNGDQDSETLLCDNCDRCCHVHCAGLDAVPSGDWFCYQCLNDTSTDNNIGDHGRRLLSRLREREGLSLAQRSRINRERREHGNWARVWRAIFEQTSLDVDFPFDDEHEHQTPRRRRRAPDAEQALEDAWERRAHVAEQQGAGSEFPDFESTRRLIVTPRGESQDELRAWNAFEKARTMATDPEAARGRKRKSRTSSPRSPQDPEHSRKFKRPRTHPFAGAAGSARAGSASSSRRTRESSAVTARSAQRNAGSPPATDTVNFLTSLLNEVESSTTPNAPGSDYHYYSDAVTHGSPQASSPGSPYQSNHATPTALTPQVLSPSSRLSSPPPMSLNSAPISPTFSPYSSPARNGSPPAANARPDSEHDHRFQRPGRTHASLSYEHKSEVQKWVSDTLKPHYRKSDITKEEYTMINRDVSRMLYDRVAHDGGLADDEARTKWKAEAGNEVKKAVGVTLEAKKGKGKRPMTDAGIGRAPRPAPVYASGSG